MDAALTSMLNSTISAREGATVVDPGVTDVGNAASGHTVRSRDLFSDAELDFEARNWRGAREDFKARHKDMERVGRFLSQQSTPQEAKIQCEEAQKRATKEYVPAMWGVLSKIEAFMKVGDVAMKSAPESVGLAWMGVRLCMHSVQDDVATFNLFSGAAQCIVGILISCRVYGKMYGGDGGQKGLPEFEQLHQKVVDYIPSIYSQILEFSYQMSKQMDRKAGVRIIKGLLSSAASKFKGMIDGIRASEKQMSEYAQMATDQLSIYYHQVGLKTQGTVLANQETMKADLASITRILSENANQQRLHEQLIKDLECEKKDMKKKTPFEEANDKFEENKGMLRPTADSENAFERARAARSEGTCEWVFELEEYRQWRYSKENSILWVQGGGGMGKSVLMANVIHRLQGELEADSDTTAQFFICSTRDDSTKLGAQVKNQLIARVYQLAYASGSPDILKKANEIVDRFVSSKAPTPNVDNKKSATASFEDTYMSLANILGKRIFLVVDALDECVDRQESHLVTTLKGLLSSSNGQNARFNMIMCSRPETDILNDLSGSPVIKIEEHNAPDIERDAKSKINGLPGFSDKERSLACEAIVKKAKGWFRCVDPAIDFLKKPLRRPLELTLEELPAGLDNSYLQAFRQTDPQYLDLLKTALYWCILGKRKPTIAEVMDDYSRAYDQEDGSEVNPYDQLEDPTLQTDAKRLIHDQIRKAGSNIFLEIEAGRLVKTRHTTVTDFFLPSTAPPDLSHVHHQESLCAECKSKAAPDQVWALTRKEGHLRMAITIFKHLNSPLFRKRYLPTESELEGTGEAQMNSADNGVTKDAGPGKDAVSNEILQDNNSASPDDPEPTGDKAKVQLTEQTSSGTRQDEEADADVLVNGVAETAKGQEEPDVPVSPDAETKSAPTANNDLDDDDDEHEDDEPERESSEDGGQRDDIVGGINVRYELTFWPHHLQQAESLWTAEEKRTSEVWKELWGLVLKFFCGSPAAFRTWQQKFMLPPDNIWDTKDKTFSPLQIAAMYGLTELCRVLIQHGESASAVDSEGRSALWFAADYDIELLRLLLENGADPNQSKSSMTPFHRVFYYVDPPIEKFKLMLDFKADCKIGSIFGYTAVHWCGWFSRKVETLRLLLAHGGEINAVDEFGETGLHKLMWQDPTPVDLLHAFVKAGADVNRSDKEGQQPLYDVCCQGSAEGCRILLEYGADIQHADVGGITALHAAAMNGFHECIKLLIEKGASLSKKDKLGRTAFWHACANGYVKSAGILLNAAHEQNHHEILYEAAEDGRTPFSKACGSGHIEVIKAMLEHTDAQIDINAAEGPHKRTALHWAARHGRVDVVSVLLENGADATVRDSDGKTALSLGGIGWYKDRNHKREPLILALIDHDATTAAQDSDLMANAAIHGSVAVIEKLLDAKASPSKQDQHGWTPLQLARQHGHTEAASVLAKRGAVVGAKPTAWTTDIPELKLSNNGLTLEYIGKGDPTAYTVLSNHPVPAGIDRFYFEITISPTLGSAAHGKDPENAIGFATQPFRPENHLPGWWNLAAPSWGYHGDDGCAYPKQAPLGPDAWTETPYGKGGATVGCGVVYRADADGDEGVEGNIFFTRDGVCLGVAFREGVVGRLFPAVGMREVSALEANFGEKPFVWGVANSGRKYGVEDVKRQEKTVP